MKINRYQIVVAAVEQFSRSLNKVLDDIEQNAPEMDDNLYLRFHCMFVMANGEIALGGVNMRAGTAETLTDADAVLLDRICVDFEADQTEHIDTTPGTIQ